MLKLYGSNTSPYVRRIRLLLDQLALDWEYIQVDIFSPEGQKILDQNTPIRKIPFLQDGTKSIWDSGLIAEHLFICAKQPGLSLEQKMRLYVIDAANDALINLLLCKRSGFDVNEDRLFFNLQHKRVQTSLDELEKHCLRDQFSDWDYLSQSLASLLDWMDFRELRAVKEWPKLSGWLGEKKKMEVMKRTDPRG